MIKEDSENTLQVIIILLLSNSTFPTRIEQWENRSWGSAELSSVTQSCRTLHDPMNRKTQQGGDEYHYNNREKMEIRNGDLAQHRGPL